MPAERQALEKACSTAWGAGEQARLRTAGMSPGHSLFVSRLGFRLFLTFPKLLRKLMVEPGAFLVLSLKMGSLARPGRLLCCSQSFENVVGLVDPLPENGSIICSLSCPDPGFP